VEQTIRDAFTRAQDYDRAFAEFKSGKRAIPPRRDLQLDALSEIVHGTRLIHCHSYRQDEILMLMRLTESFGFRVNTFHAHPRGLQGRRRDGDAWRLGVGLLRLVGLQAGGDRRDPVERVPDVGSRRERGLQLRQRRAGTRLNTEAAKAIKYGGVPREEALKMVTLNPGQVAEDRQARGLDRGGEGRRLRALERRAAVALLGVRADVDRGPEVLRPRRDLAGRAELAPSAWH
jgi:N-acetylglucosamine-6-phosphate deacetylase